jgi:hypothetical protein
VGEKESGNVGTYRIDWHFLYGSGSGYHTIDVNIPPALVVAQTWLYGHAGGGAALAGIKHYRKRLDNGEDQDIDFGEWLSWPPVIFDTISSITAGLATGEDQDGWGVLRMDFWE